MISPPELSIIVPVFNSSSVLERCIKSILEQTVVAVEIICINDGSLDNSLQILESFSKKDARIVIIDKENGGMSSARNAGLDIARGKYIGFVDSDDYIEPEMFETVLGLIKEDEVDLVQCGTEVIYRAWSAERLRDEHYFKVRTGRVVDIEPGKLEGINAHVWNKLFKRELIEQYNIRFPDGLWYEDAVFVWCYLSISSTISFTNEKLYNYVRYPSSIMGKTFSKNKMAIDHINISQVVYDFLVKNNRYFYYRRDFFNFAAQNIFLAFKYLPWGEKKEAVIKCHYFLKAVGGKGTIEFVWALCKKVLLKLKKVCGRKPKVYSI